VKHEMGDDFPLSTQFPWLSIIVGLRLHQ